MKVFEEYIQQRSVLIKKNWKKYLAGRDEECLHQMRVEIKKLMAILYFIHEKENSFVVQKHSKLLNQLMEISGELRDHHNFKLLAEKFHFKIPSLQIQVELFECQQALQKLQVYYRKHHTGLSQLKKEADKHLKDLTAGQLTEYVAERTKRIIGRMEKGLAKDQLHELRKNMKEVIYLNKLQVRKPGQLLGDGAIDKMDELQDLIGHWHDLKKFEGKIKELKNIRPVKRVMDGIDEEEKKLWKEIFKLPLLIIEEAAESMSA